MDDRCSLYMRYAETQRENLGLDAEVHHCGDDAEVQPQAMPVDGAAIDPYTVGDYPTNRGKSAMNILPVVTLSALVSMFVCAAPARAASIAGVVAEEGGEPVGAAEVILTNADSRVVLRKDYTDAKGEFRFKVKPGVFKIGAFKSAYSTAWSERIAVGHADVAIRVELEPEAFVEDRLASPDEEDCD